LRPRVGRPRRDAALCAGEIEAACGAIVLGSQRRLVERRQSLSAVRTAVEQAAPVPTISASPRRTGVLQFVRNARNSGHSCILIAHNIHHVFQVVDRNVVMRRGRIVADDIDPKTTSVAEVENVITGDIPSVAD
jgi:ABC-type lipopolysaccharide export system ATPase subunit